MSTNFLKTAILVVFVMGVFFATPAFADAVFDQGALIREIEEPLTFVFIPKLVHPWYDVAKEGAEVAIEEFAQLGIEIEMIWDSPPIPEITDHMRRIETNIARRPDGLAIACLDPASNTQIINDAVNAGLNVVTFDTDAPESLRKVYIGHNKDFQDGYDLAVYLAELIDYEGEVAVLSGTLSAPNHVGRVDGFRAAMEEFPDITIVDERPDNDELQRAVDLTESLLQAFPNLEGIFGCNATNPIGAARAVKDAGKAGEVRIVGMDDMPETIEFLMEGVIDAVKVQRQWEVGYWTIKYLVAMNQNHTVPIEHPTGSSILTAADLQ